MERIRRRVDVLVLATGYVSPFSGDASPAQRARVRILGRDGRDMEDKWAEGVANMHGIASNGFPNLFFLGLAQAGLLPNFTHMLRNISRYVAYIPRKTKEHVGEDGWRNVTIKPTREAEEDWVMHA